MFSKKTFVFGAICLIGNAVWASSRWAQHNDVKPRPEGWEVVGVDPFLVSDRMEPAGSAQRSYVRLAYRSSRPATFAVYWMKDQEPLSIFRHIAFPVAQADKTTEIYIDFNKYGGFGGADVLRIHPDGGLGLIFDIVDLEFVDRDRVPTEHLIKMIDLHCFTSKLHYLPNENIEFKACLFGKNYPERRSSKLLTAQVINSAGSVVASSYQHYELQEAIDYKELFGYFIFDKPLAAGRYELSVRSSDPMCGLELSAKHIFSVIDPETSPYIYETSFKYVKDFTIVQDRQGVFHIFSITGPFYARHDWVPYGHERSFSHGTSLDLRHWQYHPPVLFPSDSKYPDGNGYYENHGVWAPHIVKHNDIYYMFYTSANKQVSQSISLATSKDLFNWTKHPNNPIFTLENVDGIDWRRDGWADCRDPIVFIDEDGRFYLYVTAHLNQGDLRGAVVVAESDNLIQWRNPRVAVKGIPPMESPQVWKEKGHYFMTTSSRGQGTFISEHPVSGWRPLAFPRPPIHLYQKDVPTSSSYAEEVLRLADGRLLIGSLTWRLWGNSLYFFEVISDENGVPIDYRNKFDLKPLN